MKRTAVQRRAVPQRNEGATGAAAALPPDAFEGVNRLFDQWQRLLTGAWGDVTRQAEAERTEAGEVQWPLQVWALQSELMAAQGLRMARLFQEALAAALDLQSHWFRQFEAQGASGLQAWMPQGPAQGGALSPWTEWQQQWLSVLRHDAEDRPAA